MRFDGTVRAPRGAARAFSRARVIGMTLVVAALAGSTLFTTPAISSSQQAPIDLIIRGGRVFDGTGNPWIRADVAVLGSRIVAVGDLSDYSASVELDATGLFVAPGFIDVHSHASGGLTSEDRSDARTLLYQGVTTVVINPDGRSPDIAEQRAALLEHGLGVNAAQMVGHGTIRGAVIGMEDRAPTADELARMEAIARTGMEEGAFGLSSGLFYAPGSYAELDEVIALAKVVAEHGGVYASHIRDEADYTIGVVASVEEVIRVAREAGIPGVVTHIKALGPNVWGESNTIVQRIDAARADGVEMYADQYPYEASSTGLSAALLPRWSQAGGREAQARRFADLETRARIRAAMVENLARRGGADRIQFTGGGPQMEGRTLQALADEQGIDPIDVAIEILTGGGPGSIISFNMHTDDVRTLMVQPWTMTSSDGGLPRFGAGKPHPRSYGTFPRKIRRYVLEDEFVTLPSAIRSMTSLPATAFRIEDRGVIRPGAYADIVVFDLDQITDLATYAEPHQYAEGVVHVLVNGAVALRDGEPTGTNAGAVLRRNGPPARGDPGAAPASNGPVQASLGVDQMLADVEFLASDALEGRRVGSEGSRVAREYIVEAFEAAGLSRFGDYYTRSFRHGRNGDTEGVDVVGYVPGTVDPGRFIVLSAHYDHLGVRRGEIYNGADDNASGTAAAMALARYFAANPPRHSIIFAAMDAEEGGLAGAKAFVADPPVDLDRIALNVNLDMVSHSDGDLWVAGTHHYPFLAPYVERVMDGAKVTLRFGHDSPGLGRDDWTNSSDHGPFHDAGIPFLYFGVEDHDDYHRPTDDFENINTEFYAEAVRAIMAILLELDADLEPVIARHRVAEVASR